MIEMVRGGSVIYYIMRADKLLLIISREASFSLSIPSKEENIL